MGMRRCWTTEIRILQPTEWSRYRAVRLHSLAESPDEFGGTFAAAEARSDEAWEAQRTAASESAKTIPSSRSRAQKWSGCCGRRSRHQTIGGERLSNWVVPEHRCRGIGSELLDAVMRWARSRNACSIHLGVTCGDSSASRLYGRKGFEAFGPAEVLRPGSALKFQPMRLPLGDADL